MPKKFKGENSKAAVARARKAAQKEEEDRRKQAELEDEYWKDDDKHIQRKQQRKEEREKKRLEALQRKKEAAALLEAETSAIKAGKIVNELPLEENINRVVDAEGEARSVDDAISLLSIKEPELDKHPERRMKAAFQEYEEKNLPRLKAENPNLRLSQLKQMLKKDWMKSPENPMNQRHLAYNIKK
ncbi:hypothetical protein LSH36_58g11026 [Paralvinella palmiformis]|uniref:Coiled-coil domain-containing protein n=1 Tax=Paralvinella palmiformis TaxID=53620 RepID=A0AAD9K6E6_9ANNE|nr:hypothetical protein LSH36_58g11026 [Paralvinella palmiformis]